MLTNCEKDAEVLCTEKYICKYLKYLVTVKLIMDRTAGLLIWYILYVVFVSLFPE